MSALLATLRRAGLLGDDAVQQVTAFAAEHQLAHVDAVIRLRLVAEDELVRFLQSKLMIPRADRALLERLDIEIVSQLPAELAWDYAILPLSLDDANNLTLGMADPTDVKAVQAAAAHTGAYLIRAVAPATALREAILRYHGARPPRRRTQAPPSPEPVRTLLVEADEAAAPMSPAALAQFLPRLRAALDRDAILELLLGFLGNGFRHVIVFLHLQGQLRGRDARGPDLLRDAVTQVRIPTGPASVFSVAIESGTPFHGPWPRERPIDVAFADALGGIDGDAIVLPVRLRDKTPVVVFAAGPRAGYDAATLDALQDGVSTALEQLIFRRKSRETSRVE
ncbi:MAG: hypothetical protein IAG13_07535 [Deltaproteobacteria bacterium]|nr:hypothetical protein [Nannocystaceae bacterium]